MAKSKTGDLVLRVLVAVLFICIGIQGMANYNSNGLYAAVKSEVFSIILGIVIFLAGLLILVPVFYSRIPKIFVNISMVVVLVVWVLVIIFADFVYGLKHTSGMEWFSWIENFIYHLLILSCVWNVSRNSVAELVAKKKK